MASPDLVGIVVRDMGAALGFYRLLGLDVDPAQAAQPHVELVLPNGFRFAWDDLEMIKGIYPDWVEPTGHRIALAFKCADAADVDATYNRVVAAGHDGYKEPWDAFWGQRYAVLHDPDGNTVELFAAL